MTQQQNRPLKALVVLFAIFKANRDKWFTIEQIAEAANIKPSTAGKHVRYLTSNGVLDTTYSYSKFNSVCLYTISHSTIVSSLTQELIGNETLLFLDDKIETKQERQMAINTAKLSSILQNFVTVVSDVEGAALISPDGLTLSASLPPQMDYEQVSAIAAAMISLGEHIGSVLTRGNIERIFVEGEKGYGIFSGCGKDAVLLVLASEAANQGILVLEIKRVIVELGKAII